MNVNLSIKTSLNAVNLAENTAYQAIMDNVSGPLLDCILLSAQLNRLMIGKKIVVLMDRAIFITNTIS
jgi:hypothetical protein